MINIFVFKKNFVLAICLPSERCGDYNYRSLNVYRKNIRKDFIWR